MMMFAELRELLCSGAIRRHQLGAKDLLTPTSFYTDKSFVPCFPKEAGAFPFCPQGMKKTVLLA